MYTHFLHILNNAGRIWMTQEYSCSDGMNWIWATPSDGDKPL